MVSLGKQEVMFVYLNIEEKTKGRHELVFTIHKFCKGES